MNLFRWQWKDSREVEPLAHLYVVSWIPSLEELPVSVYRSTPGTSWMHFTCLFWVRQMCSIFAWSSSGTPSRSLPFSPIKIGRAHV